MSNYVYRKGKGKPTSTDKLVKTFNINGKIESVREIKRILKGISDGDTLAVLLEDIATQLNNAIREKYTKPTGGIPKTDLENSVQQSLNKADTALQKHQDLSDLTKDISDNADNIAENKELISSLTQILLLALTYGYDTPTESINPEFMLVVTDLDGRILLAKLTNGKFLIMGKQYELN